MKKITITNVKMVTDIGSREDLKVVDFEMEGDDDMEASDGYHTFRELYEHRITLFIALCESINHYTDMVSDGFYQDNPWRSKLHADGSMFDGWFIMGIGKRKGEQITYHLPISKWEETDFAETFDKAPEWDGHTPADVLERLKNL